MIDRNTCVEFAYNSRLDTIQAVVAKYVLKNKLSNITEKRIKNSLLFDELLKDILEIEINTNKNNLKEVFHLYLFKTKKRNEL